MILLLIIILRIIAILLLLIIRPIMPWLAERAPCERGSRFRRHAFAHSDKAQSKQQATQTNKENNETRQTQKEGTQTKCLVAQRRGAI